MRRIGQAAVVGGLATIMIVALHACAPVHQSNAQQALGLGHLDEAADEIQKAQAADPSNLEIKHLAAEIFTQRGTSFYKKGEMLAAEDDFRRAVDYEPTYAAAYDYLGLIAFSKHDWQGAIGYGDRYAGLSGQSTPLYVQQAKEQQRIVHAGGKALIGPQRIHSAAGGSGNL